MIVEQPFETDEMMCLRLEKDMCAALGREWRPAGMSVESLVGDLIASHGRLQALVTKPITMQDVRLMTGEGKLLPNDYLAGVNAVLRMRAGHQQLSDSK